ncbi:MAG: hypothetical protein IJ054_03770 [Lachnospiraceae bacterium]|nr:hypothetical protein [Lachnospiraceae bacterium]
MSYKIAVATSDEINVDETFGQAKRFIIYEVDGKTYKKIEERNVEDGSVVEGKVSADVEKSFQESIKTGVSLNCDFKQESGEASSGCDPKPESCEAGVGCGSGNGCGGGGGCGGNGEVSFKISSLFDCRAVVCKKIGISAQKQFEKKAISYFDVSCSIEEALDKITFYYNRIDNHVSLRNKTD